MTEPKYLYHYTTFEGLKGIIEKNMFEQNMLMLSNAMGMSDRKEFRHSENLIKHWIQQEILSYLQKEKSKIKDGIPQEVFNNLLEIDSNSIYEILLKPFQSNKFPAYLFCFCDHKDPYIRENGLLSMWRGYGNKGGYALVFNREKIEEYIQELKISLTYPANILPINKVSYREEKDCSPPPEFEADIKNVKDLLRKFITSFLIKEPAQDHNNEQYQSLFKLIMFVKNYGFHEESEYRLCILPIDSTHLPPDKQKDAIKPKIRETGLSLVEYIEFPINISDTIEKIIIGPQANMESKKQFLDNFLKSLGLNIEVTLSNIPYLPH